MNRLTPIFPALLGLLLATLWQQFDLPNPIFYLRISLSSLLLLLGILASTMLAVLHWRRRQQQSALHALRDELSIDRRRFLQRLDHELKNPLMALRASLTNLKDSDSAERRAAAFNSAELQTVRLSRLTSDLRKIADLETRPLQRTTIDLTALLQEIHELAQEQRANVTLTIPQAPWPLPTIDGDWDLLFLAIYNLVDNGIKFTQPSDKIELRAREDGATIVIEVADTGQGVAAEELPYVWDELYRGTSARGIAGSGLGLALARAIVRRHDGSVSFDSRAGQGTLVAMRLPLTD